MLQKMANQYLLDLKSVCDQLSIEDLILIIKQLEKSYLMGKQIFTMGNGGSGSTASHIACDLNKGCSYGLEKKFKVLCLNDNIPTILAYGNDVSYDEIFVEQLKNFLTPEDTVIGISGSGNSKNVILAIEYAKSLGAKTVSITGFNGGKLAMISDISLVVPIADMQIVEDVHLVVSHMIMRSLSKKQQNCELNQD